MSVPFAVNINRYSPYPNYRFLVYLGKTSSPVAAVSKVTAIKRSTEVIEYKEGGNAIILKSPGRTKYEAVTLERGLTRSLDFISFANAVQVLDHGSPNTSLANLRQEVRIDLLNEEGQVVYRVILHNAWVSEFQALPDLDAGANATAIEHMKLEHEGWEQDLTLPELLEL